MIKHIKKLSGANTILFFGLLYTIIITVAFITPTVVLPKIDLIIQLDKLFHVLIYIILVFNWLWYYFIKQNRSIVLKSIITILFLCFLYGILIEVFQQLFVSSRQADNLDILANSIGLIIGTFVFFIIKTRIKT